METRPVVSVAEEVAHAVAGLEGDTLAVMLYGSYARGDADASSDVDLLQVVPSGPRSYTVGQATVVSYDPDQLRAMSQSGSLFAWHLRTEGVILEDRDGILSRILAEHAGPAVERTLRRVSELAAVLDVQRTEFELYGQRLLRTARYLLRTAVYARSFAAGQKSFALPVAAAAAGAQEYLPLLLRGELPVGWETLVTYRDALRRIVAGPSATNRYGSLEALAVNTWAFDRQVAALAIQAMSSESGEIEYTTLPAPVL